MKTLEVLLAALTLEISVVVIEADAGKLRDIAGALGRPMDEGAMPSLDGATAWLNSTPLTTTELRGKVVLVDFWTYSCINWIRTEPYVRAWAEKYGNQGLVVIGVHSPEFTFEQNLDNVRRAVKDMNVDYPVAVDNRHAVWRAFGNEYWPALYLVDAKGVIRYHQFGEGGYARTERMIQQLLEEAGAKAIDRALVSPVAHGVEAPADWNNLRSQENYLGFERTVGFASAGGVQSGAEYTYSVPGRLELNHWALGGTWTIQERAIALHRPNGRIAYRFHARDLHLVMGPSARGSAVRFRVRIDGHAPGLAHGVDIDADGFGTATEQRMYQLVRQPMPIDDRLFEIEFLESGIEAFSFTFG
jgi:thiol-disulfide isomerase/thioredoxin